MKRLLDPKVWPVAGTWRERGPAVETWWAITPSRKRAEYHDPATGEWYEFARPWEQNPWCDVVFHDQFASVLLLQAPKPWQIRNNATNQLLFTSAFERVSLDTVLQYIARRGRQERGDWAAGGLDATDWLRQEVYTVLRWSEAEFTAEWVLEGLK